ncbi:MAG: SGNH/GDSL hydrolase family protein [Microthrixaceae bacterium]|jgi:lysophospholipase L1-like esterase|nr:SGNH/GDSL hydrolase family protein [Microthrixaceae bacterium]
MTRTRHRLRTLAGAAILATAAAGACAPPGPSTGHRDARRYVALGDSWSAGALTAFPVGDPLVCARSPINYPSLVAAALDVSAFVDRTCGSASFDDLAAVQKVGFFGLPLGTAPPQLDALDESVELITIGMGGNDIGLPDFAVGCLNVVPIPLGPPPFGRSCQETFVANGVDKASEAIVKTRAEADLAFRMIRARAPRARVFVIGYPTGFPADGAGCFARWPVLDVDAAWVAAKMHEMNEMLRSAANLAGFTFVDLEPSSVGHDGCKPQGTAWVNGITFVPDGVPLHPNSLGQANAARVIEAAIRQAG